jgi:hypothetical protein
MRDDTQTGQSRAPEAEERAVGVASVPDHRTEADDGQPRLVDDGDHDYPDHDEHTDDDEHGVAEAHGPSEAPAGETGTADDTGEAPPGQPSQRVDAQQPPARELPRDEARDDVGSRDADAPDAVASEEPPVPAMARQFAGQRAGVDESEAADESRAADQTHHHELMPGDVAEQQVSGLFEQHAAEGFRDRWQRVQMQFVDDPKSAADQAGTPLDDVLTAAREALDEKRRSLESWRSEQSDDTERLRVAVRGYRDFLDRMLGLWPDEPAAGR